MPRIAEMLNIRKEALQILAGFAERRDNRIRRKEWEDKLGQDAPNADEKRLDGGNEYIQQRAISSNGFSSSKGGNHKYCLSAHGGKVAGKQMGRLTKALSLAEVSDKGLGVDSDGIRGKQIFVIRGPYEIPCDRLRSGRIIHPLHGTQLWAETR